MKRLLIVSLVLAALAGCQGGSGEKVMARYVPERADDFVFENSLVAGRFYGKALEGNPTSPGIDIWVKLPGRLVADEWYKGAQEDPDYYHHNHGGKDCYKVAVSLGGGASAPMIDGKLCYPATNYRSFEMLEETPEKVVFVLHYPQWQASETVSVSLDKQVTVCPIPISAPWKTAIPSPERKPSPSPPVSTGILPRRPWWKNAWKRASMHSGSTLPIRVLSPKTGCSGWRS